MRIQFDAMPPFKKLPAMCRFYLRHVTPSLELYVSPLNIDPEHPALPISTPPDYARDLSRRVGPYYTLGIAEDTKALEAGVFTDREFVTQTDTLLAERGLDTASLTRPLERADRAFLVLDVSHGQTIQWALSGHMIDRDRFADPVLIGRSGDAQVWSADRR
jgi:hypothetical protein